MLWRLVDYERDCLVRAHVDLEHSIEWEQEVVQAMVFLNKELDANQQVNEELRSRLKEVSDAVKERRTIWMSSIESMSSYNRD